jgi:predicted PilT family ATPase
MTEDTLTWSFDGPTNSVATFTAPKAQIVAITEADRNMIVTDEITWQCNRNGSNIDQEISLTFTAAT